MSFKVPDDDDESLPSTPDYRSKLVPPPSSQASSTPAGAPSASFMGSSLMKAVGASPSQSSQSPSQNPFALSGLDGNTPPIKNPFANTASVPKAKNTLSSKPPKSLFARGSKANAPLGRSLRSSGIRKPSRLREEVVEDDDDDDDDDDGEEAPQSRTKGSFQVDYGNESEEDAEGDEDYDDRYQPAPQTHNRSAKVFMETFDEYSDAEGEDDGEGDMWLDMEGNEEDAYGEEEDDAMGMGDESDLMMLHTPAADQRVFREAEGIFRATASRSGIRRHSFRCATFARDIYSETEYAPVTEPPELILDTETLIARLYKDGFGLEEDDERLDETLAAVTAQLTRLWKQYVDNLPPQSEEHVTEIGPAPQSSPFEKAAYLATLALQLHHTRTGYNGRTTEPLPKTLFRWLAEYHNPYPSQTEEVLQHKPCPASHSMFWPTVCMALLRGEVEDAQTLLQNAAWEKVKANRRGEFEYTGRALDNVRCATEETCIMLEECPAKKGNWEIWSSEWTLFRIKARGKLEQLRRFAEGKNVMALDIDPSESTQSLTATARKAESQVPWGIYENLNIVFEIALGAPDVILDTAQDWCEATIGLFGWWDESTRSGDSRMPASRSLALAPLPNGADSYVERLARSFHTAMDSQYHFNPTNPVEVGMACVFEDNPKAVIAILRTWSLPVASAVAEIASLGRWLPPHHPSALYAFDDLDAEDLEVLGVNPQDPDEMDGLKDNTLIQYAQELANYKPMSSVQDGAGVVRDGWEVAIHVLGRMDSPQRSEETVGELVENILQEIDVDSSEMVDKVWRLLNDLGMVQFAEQAAEVSCPAALRFLVMEQLVDICTQHFGDILKDTCFRYGEAMWYYALAHRVGKVRDVMHFLIAYCLIQSCAYPAPAELDDHLRRLLKQRKTTLEQLASQDLEAAELLGKMLSGYATLRKFYETRDDESIPQARRYKTAATALTMVIASSDDNIRGGLYDASRDAIVGEDFLLALLGEMLVFVNHKPQQQSHYSSLGSTFSETPLLTLDQLGVLLKAVEDVQTVGGKVYQTASEFFQLVLASGLALLKGSTPADMMKSTGGSMALSGPSMLASQLHRSVAGGQQGQGTLASKQDNAKRGWDWRYGLDYSTKAEDVLRILRLGLTKDLAKLWLVEADGGML